jgi:hypothetical protein
MIWEEPVLPLRYYPTFSVEFMVDSVGLIIVITKEVGSEGNKNQLSRKIC